MSLTKDDMRVGLVILVADFLDTRPGKAEVTVIGFDPYEKKWVAASPDWAMGVSHLEDSDYDDMEIKNV